MPDKIDYKALARQHGGVPVEDQPPQPITDLPGNIMRSAGQFGRQIVDAAKGMVLDEKGNPISLENPLGATPTGIANLALGTANKFGPGHVGPKPMTEYPEAVGEFYKQRYGGLENIGNTALEDPVGMAADLSVVLGGASLGARGATRLAELANLPRVAGVLGEGAKYLNIGSAVTDPIRVAGNIPASLLRTDKIPLVNRLRPEALYQSAMKPRPSLSDQRGRVEGMMRTALEERLPATEGSLNKGWRTVEDLQGQVQADINAAAARGVTLDPVEIAKRLDDVEAKARNQMLPAKDLEKLRKMRDEFLAEHQTVDPVTGAVTIHAIPADVAQAQKQGTYQKLKGKYGKEAKEINVEGLKALARGANEELRKFIPEITEPNVRQSKLLDFLPELQRAMGRIKNYQLLSFGTPAVATAAYALTGDPMIAGTAAALKAVFDHPTAKSKLAIAIYYGMKANPDKYGPARMATATARANEYIEKLRQQAETAPAPAVP